MCGIAGFFFRQSVPQATAAAVLAALRQRGPDAQHSVFWDAQFARSEGEAAAPNALLHARLSIIDPRPLADQPMANERGDIWLCYNGEVYDYAEPQAALLASGVRFRTRSDTEFILKAYEAWGIEGLLERLRGMFAFAIVDLRQGKIHLARDRFGEKPLLYAQIGDDFAFASLVRSLLPLLPRERRAFNPAGIDAYLAHRYIPAPETIFADIRRLENGHRLEFDLSTRRLSKRCYWQPKAEASAWLPQLDTAVRMRTVADRPLGLLLSGGVDSTVIASRLAGQQLTQFSTFTATFPEAAWDESAQARHSAEILGFANHTVPIPTRIGDDFERIIADLDQPFADPSSLPTWYLAREVSRHVKVALVGDGGDELLAGYKRTYKHLRSAWRQRLQLPLPIRPSLDSRGAGKWMAELAMDWESAYALRFSGFTPGQRRFLHGGRALDRLGYWRSADGADSAAGSPLDRLLALDFANYLPEYILQKSDLCTMAHGLEGRAPLLDHRLFQCLMSVPDAERYTHPPKALLRTAVDKRLEAAIFNGKKRGFNPPLKNWLRNDLADRRPGLGQRLAALTQGQLDAAAVDRFAQAYAGGEEHLAEQLLQLLILDTSLGQLRALADAR